MQKIVPCLWFDSEAEEAARFYTSIFPDSKIGHIEKYVVETPSNKPIGSVMTVEFDISGYKFLGLNGGSYFKPNPSISFQFKCDSVKEVDEIYYKISEGGEVLMELGEYPFSRRYAWVEDKYGVSWQIMLFEEDYEERIVPVLMFTQEQSGKAQEALNLYENVFSNTEVDVLARYEEGEEPDKEGTIKYAKFVIEGQEFGAMDSAREHGFTFNEAVSLMIYCKDQEEIDHFYDRLSASPEAEICGWLKDEYGISWQLLTKDVEKLGKSKKVMEAMLEMKRIDVNKLKEIYNQ